MKLFRNKLITIFIIVLLLSIGLVASLGIFANKTNNLPDTTLNQIEPFVNTKLKAGFYQDIRKDISKNNILIVENLANMEKIPSKEFNFIILPLKLKDATGSPVRAIAF